jgi:hypothetical protein
VNRLNLCAQDVVEGSDQVQKGVSLPASDVEHMSGGIGGARGQQIGVYDVGDVGKVARLAPVAVDGGGLVPQHGRDEQRDDRRVLRGGVLPGAKDVKVAQAHRLQAVHLG